MYRHFGMKASVSSKLQSKLIFLLVERFGADYFTASSNFNNINLINRIF